MSEYLIIFGFINQSKDYTLGFEYGFLYYGIKEGEEIDFTIHNDNIVQIKKTCQMFGIEPEFQRIDDTFSQLIIKRTTV